jgi:hypothetical protein
LGESCDEKSGAECASEQHCDSEGAPSGPNLGESNRPVNAPRQNGCRRTDVEEPSEDQSWHVAGQ